jgi:hypothetical protein
MGYTTDFNGSFSVSPTLKPEHREFLAAFSETRRMKRNVSLLPADANSNVGLGLGEEGGYYVGDSRYSSSGLGVINCNTPPANQPGLWCQWTPNEDGTEIEWDGGEKFYEYVEWLEYIIEHFLQPWGYILNGKVYWYGEDRTDVGCIIVENNVVSVDILLT